MFEESSQEQEDMKMFQYYSCFDILPVHRSPGLEEGNQGRVARVG